MILASWHSVQVVCTFSTMRPAGNFGAEFCAHAAPAMTTNKRKPRRLCHMDFHLINSVPQISAGIPARLCRLHAATAVLGSRHDDVLAAVLCRPRVLPQAPRILHMIRAELSGRPGFTTVS